MAPFFSIATALLVCTVLTFVLLLWKQQQGAAAASGAAATRTARLPRPLPFIGHLHLLARGGGHPHAVLRDLATKHGLPIMLLRFGSVPVVVASTKEAAMEFLQKHDLAFASRPPSKAGRLLTYNHSDMVFAPYGERWRQLRRLCTLELLTAKRLEAFQSVRMGEAGELLRSVEKSSGRVLDVRSVLPQFTFNIITRMAMGERFLSSCKQEEDPAAREFMSVMDDVFQALGEFAVGDFLPYLRWLDPDGAQARLKTAAKRTHRFIEHIVREHEHKRDRESQEQDADEGAVDFLELLFRLRDRGETVLQGDTIPALVINLLTAATDTSTVVLEWALAELMCHREAMLEVQRELDGAAGGAWRLLRESDVEGLPYFQAVVKETLRLHPPATLSVPHQCMSECNVMGVTVPKNATLLLNLYAISRSHQHWGEDADSFRPERFLLKDATAGGARTVDVRGRDFELLPFGSGRRMCPGLSLGLGNVHLALANLLLAFSWELPPGQHIDTSAEKYGLTTVLAKRLEAIPRPRKALVL